MSNTNFPGAIDTPTNPISSNGLNSPSHAGQHGFENDAIVAIETLLGITGSAVNGTVQFVLSGITGSDKAVGVAAIQTLTNKTLTAPVVNVGSDATGDLYYRNASGLLTRLGIGSTNQIISVSAGGLPNWVPNPAAASSSTTVNGTVQIAATADITAGTSTGTTGAILVVPASAVGTPAANKIVQFTAAFKYPAADGSLITNVTNSAIYKNGITVGNGTTTLTIAHGLGVAPKFIRLNAHAPDGYSFGVYNGTTMSVVWAMAGTNNGTDSTTVINVSNSGNQATFTTGTVVFDATNITITFSGTNNTFAKIMWEAFA